MRKMPARPAEPLGGDTACRSLAMLAHALHRQVRMIFEHATTGSGVGDRADESLAGKRADSALDGGGRARAPEAILRRQDRAHRLAFEDPYRVTVVFSVAGDDGRVQFSAADCQVTAGPGYVSVLPPGICGIWCSAGRMEYLSISFPVLFAAGRIPRAPFCRDDDETLERIGQVIAAALRESGTPGPWDLSAWSTLIGSHLARSYGTREPALDCCPGAADGIPQVLDCIDRNLHRRLKVADLAVCAGMSRSKFAAEFKQRTGLSPHRFIVSRRIEKAREMLTADAGSLAHIAHEAGFCSQSHMTRVFRDRIGVTPKTYRDRLRGSGQLPRTAEV